MVSEARGRFAKGVQSSPVRRLARRQRVQPRRWPSRKYSPTTNSRRSPSGWTSSGTDSDGVPDYFPGVSWGSGSPSRKPPRRPAGRRRRRVLARHPRIHRGGGGAKLRSAGLMGAITAARVFTAGAGRAKNGVAFGRGAMGGVPVDKSPYAEAAYGAALLARMDTPFSPRTSRTRRVSVLGGSGRGFGPRREKAGCFFERMAGASAA